MSERSNTNRKKIDTVKPEVHDGMTEELTWLAGRLPAHVLTVVIVNA